MRAATVAAHALLASAPSSASHRAPARHDHAALQRTLDRYESGEFSLRHKPPKPPKPPPTPPPGGGHLPGPNPGVVLPKLPHRPNGVSEIEAVLTVDKYEGLQHGRNGDHELFEGHITLVNAIANQNALDTKNVHVAMNVASNKDPAGLPHEFVLKPGQQVELEGEYIPASQAHDRNDSGDAAVIHFTHAPGGYVILPDGERFE